MERTHRKRAPSLPFRRLNLASVSIAQSAAGQADDDELWRLRQDYREINGPSASVQTESALVKLEVCR